MVSGMYDRYWLSRDQSDVNATGDPIREVYVLTVFKVGGTCAVW